MDPSHDKPTQVASPLTTSMAQVGQKRSSEWSLNCVLLLKTEPWTLAQKPFFPCGQMGSWLGK